MPTHEEFRGSHTVLATPFTADGSGIDTETLRRLVDWQIESGSHGLIPLGSTGEFLSVSDAERTQIVETISWKQRTVASPCSSALRTSGPIRRCASRLRQRQSARTD